MLQSINPSEWKARDSSSNRDTARQLLPTDLVAAASFTKTLNEAARNDARCDYKLAHALGMTPGYFSKFMRAVGEEWARRLVAYMRETNSIAPLQWLADRVGCDAVPREERT